MAEWLCSGLQSRLRRFDSGFSLHGAFMNIKYDLICTPISLREVSRKLNSDNKVSYLLSGLWCSRDASYDDLKDKLDFKFPDYHWSNRSKFLSDNEYLSTLKEDLLIKLSYSLNEIHNSDFNTEYWRILIGPWLNSFIPSVYDRWETLNNAFSNYEIENAYLIDNDHQSFVPNCSSEFNVDFNVHDIWNEFIFTKILEFFSSNGRSFNKTYFTSQDKQKSNINKKHENVIKKIIYLLGSYVSNKTYFFHNLGIKRTKIWLLEFLLRKIPSYYKSEDIPIFEYEAQFRDLINIKHAPNNDFEKFLIELIPYQIPKSFIEGYKYFDKLSYKKWPKKPKVILSTGSFYVDEYFKYYLAKQKVVNKAKFFIIQHGGHYGIGKVNSFLDHELSICDRYFSWGWSDDSQKITPMPSIKINSFKDLNYDKKGSLLIVKNDIPRYSYAMYGCPISSDFEEVENQAIKIYENVKDNIKDHTTFRFKEDVYGWKTEQMINRHYPNIKTENILQKDIMESYSESRLTLHLTNFTTYLETLSLNVPTVIYLNPAHNEYTDDAMIYINELKKSEIFFDDLQSTVNHINLIWDNVDEWWESDTVQKARSKFVNRFALKSDSFIQDFIKEMKRK